MVITVEWPVLPIALHLKHKQTNYRSLPVGSEFEAA